MKYKWTVLICAAALCSCQEAKLPPRKKMPALNSLSVPEGEWNLRSANDNAFPFATSDIDVMQNGAIRTYLRVSLPGAAEDSAAMNLVNLYRPLASTLLSQWGGIGRDGVLIDLRSRPGAYNQRADYLLEKHNAFSIPVIFLWDQAASGRVAVFMQLLGELPVNSTRISGSNSAISWQSSRQDCFQTTSPVIGIK